MDNELDQLQEKYPGGTKSRLTCLACSKGQNALAQFHYKLIYLIVTGGYMLIAALSLSRPCEQFRDQWRKAVIWLFRNTKKSRQLLF